MALANFFLLLFHFLYCFFHRKLIEIPLGFSSASHLAPMSSLFVSMSSPVLVSIVNILCLFILSSNNGYISIWITLTTFMSFCVFAGLLR
ncbi:hypothetical protein ERO13_D02G152850v2 [Gossypium hirsutum]|nr:hypothetical protein ERO13_D02G152850v2 [Gossypium hirsutum]